VHIAPRRGRDDTLAMMFDCRQHLLRGQAIPAVPLALTAGRKWDERSQAAVIRYYVDSGAGGLAVGVHSTQFAIRDPRIGLFEPVLALAARVSRAWAGDRAVTCLIAGLCGFTRQAVREARVARDLGYHAGLLSLGALAARPESEMLRHCREVAKEIPLVGFYLQPAAGGVVLSRDFWKRFCGIGEVVAIKIAPFNRYRTVDVVRAVIEAGRDDIALYTGNDDNIVADLLTPFTFAGRTRFIDGGLLGHWGVWTKRAVELLAEMQEARKRARLGRDWLDRNAAITDANAAIFDPENNFSGCIPGIHEVLRRQGLLRSTACLDPRERLSPGQAAAITRVSKAYPWMRDDDFVSRNLARWRA
jgi:dihydrodipicolinate synthase/N-acetylneuraminate lyase